MIEHDIPPCMIFIDKQGRWFHKGVEMIRRDFIRLFYENLEIDPSGRYIISLGKDRCYLDVEDTPFVVRRTSEGNAGTEGGRFILSLSDDTEEPLDPETLRVGDGDVLYCRVKSGVFPARFARPAYYQLAEHIEEEGGRFFLEMDGKRFFING